MFVVNDHWSLLLVLLVLPGYHWLYIVWCTCTGYCCSSLAYNTYFSFCASGVAELNFLCAVTKPCCPILNLWSWCVVIIRWQVAVMRNADARWPERRLHSAMFLERKFVQFALAYGTLALYRRFSHRVVLTHKADYSEDYYKSLE